jgi:hypothetical protein
MIILFGNFWEDAGARCPSTRLRLRSRCSIREQSLKLHSTNFALTEMREGKTMHKEKGVNDG